MCWLLVCCCLVLAAALLSAGLTARCVYTVIYHIYNITISRQDSREPWVTVVSGTRVGVMAGVAWDTALPAATTITGSLDTSCSPGV